MENIGNCKACVSEKIFDCTKAGIIPIYLGATDISEYVDSKCFIDYNSFSSIEEMYRFISGIEEKEYNRYLDAQREYVEKKGYEQFTVAYWANQVVRIVSQNSSQGKDKVSMIWFAYIRAARIIRNNKLRVKRLLSVLIKKFHVK